ncbi:MAG: DUF134 domain-containing protein [Methanosarcinales archaeon]|nr:MAG: DUF134 domain-containing protein [Methanosarcinales archaeon]
MVRPRKNRRVWFEPGITYFKPRGMPLADLEEVSLAVDELEAIRLNGIEKLVQKEAAKKMTISQPTFHRLLESAREKIADALVNGKAIKIHGGNYEMAARRFRCYDCGNEWEEPYGTGRPVECPKCSSANIHRAPEDRGYVRGRRREYVRGKT